MRRISEELATFAKPEPDQMQRTGGQHDPPDIAGGFGDELQPITMRMAMEESEDAETSDLAAPRSRVAGSRRFGGGRRDCALLRWVRWGVAGLSRYACASTAS